MQYCFYIFVFFSWFALIAIENKDEQNEKWDSLENVKGRFARSILKIRPVVRITFLANFKCWNYDEDVCELKIKKRKNKNKRK